MNAKYNTIFFTLLAFFFFSSSKAQDLNSLMEAAAARGKLGGMRAAKDNLVGGPPVPPSPQTDAKIQALFRVEGFSTQEQAKMDELILRAAQVAATSAPRHKTPTIARRVAASKLNAAPGPSGWRNTYLSLIRCSLVR